MRSRLTIALATAGALLTLAGCASSPGDARSAVADSALVGTWVIDDTFDSPEQPFIDFAEDGTWSASDGCNRVQGTWKLGDEGAITTTAGPSTLMACDGAQLPLAVERADYVQVVDDTLIISSSKESTETALVRSDDPTVGPLGLPIGQWLESDAEGAPFLSIAADGTITGNDGCNNMFGSWAAGDDGSIEFSGIGSTMMYCDGVDTWLTRAAKATVQGGVMTVSDESGAVLGQLTQQ